MKKKSTWCKCYVEKKHISSHEQIMVFHFKKGSLLIGEYKIIKAILEKEKIKHYYLEVDYHNALMSYPDYLDENIRIEKGAVIREGVTLNPGAIILMNACVNKGAVIGANTMIDMNAVVGSKAQIGANVHISAGVVIAGVLEPVASHGVIIKDGAFIGANSVILNGITVGENAVVGAGSIVTKDVPKNGVVYGNPARFIKEKDELIASQTALNPNLRQ